MSSPATNLLTAGDLLGPYRVEALIGKGGMSEVYRGTDTRLGRSVAIKISSREFSDRFEREAQAISSLNHPNICSLFDVGPNYLVMELVEGDTLSYLIKQGPMPLEKVLQYGIQIADALSAAHAKGVIHRDLKPANIIVTASGVKVLDFGLAKLAGPAKFAGGTEMATRTEPITESGSILGTLHYMSPEQAEGKETDERSDIFSFGVVLYEMLTGHHAYDGDSRTAVLAAILKDQPSPIQQFQPTVPRALDRVVRKCLEKKPADRWHSAHDLKQTLELIDLAGPTSASAGSASGSGVSDTSRSGRTWLWLAVAAVVFAAGVAVALWAPWRKAAPTQSVRFEVGPSENMTFINQASMAVSPDGRWMVFPAYGEDHLRHYYLRALDGVEVRALPGTEGVQPPAAWSYDSRWVLFSADNKLKKVDIQGGPAQDVADLPGFLTGAGWNPDGVIILSAASPANPILRVPASGGHPSAITAVAPGEIAHLWPQFLPDGKHFLYLRVSTDAAKSGIYIGSLDVQPGQQSMQRLLASDRQAYYAAEASHGTGHLVFLRGTTLMARPFNPNKMTLGGEPSAVAEGVDSFTPTSHGLFSVSDTGTLVYRGGVGSQSVLTWTDLQGHPAGTLGDPAEYAYPAISPDGTHVAVSMGQASGANIWILDVASGTPRRLTFNSGGDSHPAWSPDGKNIAFSSNRSGQVDLYIKPADGSGEETLLLKTDEPKTVERFTKDGRFLLFTSFGMKTGQGDLWALPLGTGAKPVALLQTRFNEFEARVSPDGRWLAYTSTESGVADVYVRPFTPETPRGSGARWQISNGGGDPIWRADSKALFYYDVGRVMAVDIDTSKGFRSGTPRLLFNNPGNVLSLGWDLSPDGKRFLFVSPPGTQHVIPFTVVLNWAAGLKK